MDAAIALAARRDERDAAKTTTTAKDEEGEEMNDDLRAAIAMSLATAAPDPAVEETTTVEAIPREDESAREVEKVETEAPPATKPTERTIDERAHVFAGDVGDDDDDDWCAAAREADRLAERARMEKLLRDCLLYTSPSPRD